MPALALMSVLACSPGWSADGCGTVVVPAAVGSGSPTPANSLHPILSTATLIEQQLSRLIYRPLVWMDANVQVDWGKSLAASVVVADDGATFRVTLKPFGWSDGVPVTADDVLYGWEMIGRLGRAYALYGVGGVPGLIRGLTVTGPHSLEVSLTRPVNPDWFESTGLSQLTPIPRHAWGGLSIARQQSLQSEASFYRVVDGPFRLERLAVGRWASFVSNPSYGGHRASIRRLVVTFLQGTDPLAELAAGQVDMANRQFTVWDATGGLRGVEKVPLGPGANFSAILPNLKSPSAPFLADVRVRQAIATAIDQRRLIGAVFHGNALPEQGFVPAALVRFLSPSIRGGASPLAFDPERAAAMLERAGWVVGSDGVRQRDGRRLAFEILSPAGSPTGLELLQMVKEDLARVGVEVRIKEAQFDQIIARMTGPAEGWQAVSLAFTEPGYPDGTRLFQSRSRGNFEHYASPTMDRLLDASVFRPGLDGLFALEDYVLAQQPMFFLPDGFYTVLARPEVGGIRDFLGSNGAWSPEYLTVSGSLACR